MATCKVDNNIYSDFHYDKLRNQNLKKIKKLYESTLNKYNTEYRNYLEKVSQDGDDSVDNKEYAENQLVPKIKELNEQLIFIKSKLKNSNDDTDRNIIKQKNLIESETDLIDQQEREINLINSEIKQTNVDAKGKSNEITENIGRNKNSFYKHLGYILLIVILLLGLAYLIYRVVYLSSGKRGNNSNNNYTNRYLK